MSARNVQCHPMLSLLILIACRCCSHRHKHARQAGISCDERERDKRDCDSASQSGREREQRKDMGKQIKRSREKFACSSKGLRVMALVCVSVDARALGAGNKEGREIDCKDEGQVMRRTGSLREEQVTQEGLLRERGMNMERAYERRDQKERETCPD